MSNRPSTPLFSTINITTACNLDCSYCFMQPRSNEFMARQDFERVVTDLSKLNVFFINISGGEPFVHPEVNEFLKIAHSNFKYVMVLSNGAAFQNSHFDAIKEILDKKGAFTLQISLDSIDTETNNQTRAKSDKVIKNISRLSAMGVHIIIAMVVSRFSEKNLLSSIRFLSRYTKYFHLMTVQDVRMVKGIEGRFSLKRQKEMELWSKVIRSAKMNDIEVNTPLNYEGEIGCATGAQCMAAFSHIVIDPSLKVRPCDRLTDVFLGDLRTTSIEKIWNSSMVRPLLDSPVPFCRLAT